MSGFDAFTYGDSFADVYDEWYEDLDDARAVADFLESFGSAQRIVELGVGTGRLAEAIAACGHVVIGADTSRPMLDRARERLRAPHLLVAADMRAQPVRPGAVDLVLVATNTLFNLDTEAGQAACFASARSTLRLGGRFVVEAFVPAPPDPAIDNLVSTRSITADRVVLTATLRDESNQRITGQHIDISSDGIRMRPWRVRYAAPAELDAMATAAGFRLGERFADWSRTPFGGDSPRHVSVYVAV